MSEQETGKLQEDLEQKIEASNLKVATILEKLNPHQITRKLVEAKLQSEEVVALLARSAALRNKADELSGTLAPVEVFEARLRRFDRLHEDFLADGKIEAAQKKIDEKNLFLQEREKVIQAVQSLNSQAGAAEQEIRALLRPVFFSSMEEIKLAIALKLNTVLSFMRKEISDFVALQEEYGIKLPFNPLTEIKIYPEGVYRTVREALRDEILP